MGYFFYRIKDRETGILIEGGKEFEEDSLASNVH